MNDKLMLMSIEMAGLLDRMLTLGIEYEKKTLSPEAFAESIRQMLAEYQKSVREFNEKKQEATHD